MPKKYQFFALVAITIAIVLYGLISNVNSNAEEKANQKYPAKETIMVNDKEISKQYFNDLVERTEDLEESIIKNLDGTKFRLHTTVLHAEKFPTQVIHLKSIKETTLKEKQNIKNEIHNMIKSKNSSNEETFEIVFEGNKNKNINN